MEKNEIRLRRKLVVRKKVTGTAERPRMSVHKSNRNLFVQLINDTDGRTVCGLSTMSKPVAGKIKSKTRKNVPAGIVLGETIAHLALSKGVKKVVFDRSCYRYHGVVKAIADGARKGGLEF